MWNTYSDYEKNASEGKFNIPSLANDTSGDLALFGYFFEFLPLGEANSMTGLTYTAKDMSDMKNNPIIITFQNIIDKVKKHKKNEWL